MIAAAAVLVAATGGMAAGPVACFAAGALKGAVVGAVVGAASGAVTGAVGHRISTGSWEGAGEAALNGAADGYMMGAITGFISGGLGNVAQGKCFVAGTAILTASGYVAIENIRAGDWVPATDPETGETALKPVVQTFVRESDELIHIHVNGEEIITTPTHPFWIPQKGWTDAVLLRAGDYLQLLNGEYVVIERIQHELLETPVTVYNFEVEDFHTYYVTQSSILVHNSCGYDNKVISQTKDKKYGSMRIDLERGGSGKYNLHLHQGNNKFMFNGKDGFIGAGKINKTEFVQEDIKKAFKYMKKIGVKLG